MATRHHPLQDIVTPGRDRSMTSSTRRCVGVMLAVAVLVLCPASAIGAAPPDDQSGRILGGTRVSISDVAWMVYLHTEVPFPRCGGSLIAPRRVLTAAHCVADQDPAAVTVVAGREDVLSLAGMSSAVAEVWVHPGYEHGSLHHDVAVVAIVSPLPGAPVQIAAAPDTGLQKPGTPAEIYGWGVTGHAQPPARYLQRAKLTLDAEASCLAAFGKIYDPTRMICAGSGENTGTCQGDSGGPLLVAGRVVGITSYGDAVRCGRPSGPEVYTRVSFYANQIQAHLQ